MLIGSGVTLAVSGTRGSCNNVDVTGFEESAPKTGDVFDLGSGFGLKKSSLSQDGFEPDDVSFCFGVSNKAIGSTAVDEDAGGLCRRPEPDEMVE